MGRRWILDAEENFKECSGKPSFGCFLPQVPGHSEIQSVSLVPVSVEWESSLCE